MMACLNIKSQGKVRRSSHLDIVIYIMLLCKTRTMLFLLKKEVIMSKPTIGQSHTVIQILATNVNWDALEHAILQEIVDNPKEAGKQFTAFLKNGGKIIVDGPRVISIDRSVSFDPETFVSNGWSIKEQDERSLALTEINLTCVMFDTTLEKGEKGIKGKDKLKRLKEKTNRIRLDAGIFKTLWENQHLIPEKWKEKINGVPTFIFFDGTILQCSDSTLYILYLYWDDGEWDMGYFWLDDENDWNTNTPSAVIESSTL
jgi:hypothetical protein